MNTYFDEVYARIQQITGMKTQLDMATFLGIRQSSISDAKRNNRIPSGWLLTLLKVKKVNPDWLLSGEGEMYMYPCSDEPSEPVSAGMILDNLSPKDLIGELSKRFPDCQVEVLIRYRKQGS